jgi:hypothetical protein
MQLGLELVDHPGAAFDDIGAIVDQHPQLPDVFINAVPVQVGSRDHGVGGGRGISGVRLGAGGGVQLAVCGGQTAGNPDHLMTGQ